MIGPGKQLHRRWVEDSFRPQLDARRPAEREALTDLLVVVTDVYARKLLRRDRGLDPATTGARMRALVDAILGS